MSTTSEIVERLGLLVSRAVPWSHTKAVSAMSDAAARLEELERENAALLEFVRMVSAIPHPDKRPEDDIDALYMNERRLAGLIRAASGHLETEKSGEKQ
jgi:hypothetical protein